MIVLWIYLAGILPVLCVGVFGIAATATERLAASIERERSQWSSEDNLMHYAHIRAANRTAGLCTLAVLAAGTWPIAVFVWLAWRKGTFIDRAVAKREQMKAVAS